MSTRTKRAAKRERKTSEDAALRDNPEMPDTKKQRKQPTALAPSPTMPTVDDPSSNTMQYYIKVLPNNVEGVAFLFSPRFSKHLKVPAERIAAYYKVTVDEAIEEFRRLLAIKTFTVDNHAEKISPTWLMDEVWHAAILDTLFYKDLQEALKITLHHRPSGASREETESHKMRLATMKSLYAAFFNDDPIENCEGRDQGDGEGAMFTVFIRPLSGGVVVAHVNSSKEVGLVKSGIEFFDGTLVEDQRLIFAGKQLEDHFTLADYNIVKDSTIYLVSRRRGC